MKYEATRFVFTFLAHMPIDDFLWFSPKIGNVFYINANVNTESGRVLVDAIRFDGRRFCIVFFTRQDAVHLEEPE